MKLKLNENLGERGRAILEQVGHEVATVAGQALDSVTGRILAATPQIFFGTVWN
ncbi:MAG: hypothetical protein RMK20_12225 [Verrucomicrobiales bacterium]|nr:hypothetical protein [Verrucomicrobiales bacterium]